MPNLTYLYTIVNGASVRVRIDLDAVSHYGWRAVDMDAAKPYAETPLHNYELTPEQRRNECMVNQRMRVTDNGGTDRQRRAEYRAEQRKAALLVDPGAG
jgi:hypothetical protein